jgi:hypothetical protein
MTLDLAKYAKQSGKSELEIAKSILIFLAVKAEVYEIPQHITLEVRQG